jgi:hypothetical protein
MNLTFVFSRAARDVLTVDEWEKVEQILLDNPDAGDLVAGTGGVRKLRVAFEGRGKRGSARTIYLHVEERNKVYFIVAYAKNVQENISAADKKAIRAYVEAIRAEGGS